MRILGLLLALTLAVPAALAVPQSAHAAGPCVTSALSGSCGPYLDRQISESNGYTTYVANNMWGCGPVQPPAPGAACGVQTVTAFSPGRWSAVSDQEAGNTAVLTYPDVSQGFTLGNGTDPPWTDFSRIVSSFAESMPHNRGTIAQAAYDTWLDHNTASTVNEMMTWTDNVNRGTGGARVIAHAVIYGQRFSVLRYGNEIIFSLDRSERSGTVHILAELRWLRDHGLLSPGAGLGSVAFGWEICSTGGRPETFAVSRFTLSSGCLPGHAASCAH
jgi:hypothetical protein